MDDWRSGSYIDVELRIPGFSKEQKISAELNDERLLESFSFGMFGETPTNFRFKRTANGEIYESSVSQDLKLPESEPGILISTSTGPGMPSLCANGHLAPRLPEETFGGFFSYRHKHKDWVKINLGYDIGGALTYVGIFAGVRHIKYLEDLAGWEYDPAAIFDYRRESSKNGYVLENLPEEAEEIGVFAEPVLRVKESEGIKMVSIPVSVMSKGRRISYNFSLPVSLDYQAVINDAAANKLSAFFAGFS